MKNIFYFLFAVMLLVSCKKDSVGSTPNGGNKITLASASYPVVVAFDTVDQQLSIKAGETLKVYMYLSTYDKRFLERVDITSEPLVNITGIPVLTMPDTSIQYSNVTPVGTGYSNDRFILPISEKQKENVTASLIVAEPGKYDLYFQFWIYDESGTNGKSYYVKQSVIVTSSQ